MSVTDNECPQFAWIVLIFFGLFNLVRGFMHTFLVEYAAENIAGLDLSVARAEQLILMMNYGFENLVAGVAFILIALKARHLVPPTILLVTIIAAVSPIAIELLNPTAAFAGRLLAPVWFALGVITLIWIYLHQRKNQ